MPPMRETFRRALMFVSASAALSLVVFAQTPQTPPVFRAGTTLVPVDVRVLDRKGNPITDLKAEDFTVLENGVPQEIRQFSAQALTSNPSAAQQLPRRSETTASSLAPQNRRLFLIVLGRGRLVEVSKTMEALLALVRKQLLPQDQVALMAWNRATDFTTDHEKIARVIERFAARNAEIEMDVRLYYSGLTALYAGREMPRAIQVKIDDVFKESANAATRQVLPGSGGAAMGRAAQDAQRTAQQLQEKSEIEARNALFQQLHGSDLTMADLMLGTNLEDNFDDYIALNRQTMQDVGNLYSAIDYLKFIDGEKHIIFVTEQGFLQPRADYDRDLAGMAADARVAIDTIQTGGVQMVLDAKGLPTVPNGQALSALRTVSEISGGQVSVSNYGDQAVARILHATEFGYLLGYAPLNPSIDGRFRKIEVKVKRKGAEVSFRHGYYARAAEDFDPRQSIAATRMSAAAGVGYDIRDLKVSFKTTDAKFGASRMLNVDATLDAEHVAFAHVRDTHVAALHYAVLCADAYGSSVGEFWKTVDYQIPDSVFDQVMLTGIKLNVQVPVRQSPSFVKMIVYDYGSDLIGTVERRIH